MKTFLEKSKFLKLIKELSFNKILLDIDFKSKISFLALDKLKKKYRAL